MRAQNRFQTGLDIARYTAKIMREDMAAYDADPAIHPVAGLLARFYRPAEADFDQEAFRHAPKGRYLYLSGWMVAALRSEFGPLPDQSMHEKTSVPALIEELYTFLKQADARELSMISANSTRPARPATKSRPSAQNADRQFRDACRPDHRRHRCRLRQ